MEVRLSVFCCVVSRLNVSRISIVKVKILRNRTVFVMPSLF